MNFNKFINNETQQMETKESLELLEIQIIGKIESDPKSASIIFELVINHLLNGSPELAKTFLAALIKATIGVEKLSKKIDMPINDLNRILLYGNDLTIIDLNLIFEALQKHLDIYPRVIFD